MKSPVCALCHTNKYVACMNLYAGWNHAKIQVDDNGIHKVNLYVCGKCGTVRVDDDTASLIKEKRDIEYEKRLKEYEREKI